MFRHKADPKEQARVLGLLISYDEAKAEIDGALHAISTEHFTDIQSDEFEGARKATLTIISKVQAEINNPSFWPDLTDNKGSRILLEFRSEFAEYCLHTLTFCICYVRRLKRLKQERRREPTNKNSRNTPVRAAMLRTSLVLLLPNYSVTTSLASGHLKIIDLSKTSLKTSSLGRTTSSTLG